MKTDQEISYLWQLAHLKVHFGEELAIQAMNIPTKNVACSATSAEGVSRNQDSPVKARKEADGIKSSELSIELPEALAG